MPFTPVDTSGTWVSMKDLAAEGEKVKVFRGFLVADDSNVYNGDPAPRWIVKSVTADGESIQAGVGKGYSRDINLVGAAEYLETQPEGTFLELAFTKTGKGAYVDVQFVGEGVGA